MEIKRLTTFKSTAMDNLFRFRENCPSLAVVNRFLPVDWFGRISVRPLHPREASFTAEEGSALALYTNRYRSSTSLLHFPKSFEKYRSVMDYCQELNGAFQKISI